MKKKNRGRNLYRAFSHCLLTVVVVLLFANNWYSELLAMTGHWEGWRGSYIIIFFYAVLFVLFTQILDGFKIGTNKVQDVLLSQALAIFIVDVLEFLIIALVTWSSTVIYAVAFKWLAAVCEHFAVQLVLVWFLCVLYRGIFRPFTMIVINGEYSNNLSKKFETRGDRYIVEGSIDYDRPMEEIAEAIKEYDSVLINDVPSEVRNKILKLCYEMEKYVYFTPKIPDLFIRSSEEIKMFDTPLYMVDNHGVSLGQSAVKRFGDIVISLVGLIITSPIMLVTAIAIKLYDHGPVLYKQVRCTIGGKEFKICKFRSMITDAEKDGKARLASENDSRITPIGKFIRATRIDELPQFINILVGDMSVVGPRPERPEINREYCESVPEFAYRLRVKAGLTGYAQVYGKYNTTNYDKLKLDLIYVEKMSIGLDIKILLLTLKTILTKEATEGVEEGQTTSNTLGNKKL